MNLKEAKQALMEIANGEYHTMEYCITDNGKGEISQRCKVYINGMGSEEGRHWETALEMMRQNANTKDLPKISEDIPASTKS